MAKTSVRTLAEETLKRHGMKKTPARVDVLELFLKQSTPLGVAEVFSRLRTKDLNYVTTYRTVNVFVEKGILRQVDLRHGHADYELVSDDDHHHIVCTTCEKTEDFEGCDLEGVIRSVLKKSRSFRSVREHALELFGTCRECEGWK